MRNSAALPLTHRGSDARPNGGLPNLLGRILLLLLVFPYAAFSQGLNINNIAQLASGLGNLAQFAGSIGSTITTLNAFRDGSRYEPTGPSAPTGVAESTNSGGGSEVALASGRQTQQRTGGNLLNIVQDVTRCDPKTQGLCCVLVGHCVPMAKCSSAIPGNMLGWASAIPTCTCNPGYQGDGRTKGTGCTNVNECLNGEAKCTQICQDQTPGYSCGCHEGFRLRPDHYTCADIDECRENLHRCSHGCINSEGSYRCTCPKGYMLDVNDRFRCVDIDECAVMRRLANLHQSATRDSSPLDTAMAAGLKVCAHIDLCRNLEGGYACGCPIGYKAHPADPTQCAEIDECSEGLDPKLLNPTAMSTDYQGGGTVAESRGAPNWAPRLGEDDIKAITDARGLSLCFDNSKYDTRRTKTPQLENGSAAALQEVSRDSPVSLIETSPETRLISQICLNTPGSFECRCAPGYRRLSRSTEQLSAEEKVVMDGLRAALSSVGARTSPPAEATDSLEGSTPLETAAKDQLDLALSQLRRGEGLPELGVRAVTVSDPRVRVYVEAVSAALEIVCEDIDECAESRDLNPCGGGLRSLSPDLDETMRSPICQNIPGSYQCLCPQGFEFSKLTGRCVDIDECLLFEKQSLTTNDSKCDSAKGHLCVNHPGGYSCQCGPGYQSTEDGSCEDIDECTMGPDVHGCSHSCVNTVGSFSCACPNGFKLSNVDHKNCLDVDECLYPVCPKDTPCINLPGSYMCGCPKGFQSGGIAVAIQDITDLGSRLSPEAKAILASLGADDRPRSSRVDQAEQKVAGVSTSPPWVQHLTAESPQARASLQQQRILKLQEELSVALNCVDIDECNLPTSVLATPTVVDVLRSYSICPPHASCLNTEGSFVCSCPRGYKLAAGADKRTSARPLSLTPDPYLPNKLTVGTDPATPITGGNNGLFGNLASTVLNTLGLRQGGSANRWRQRSLSQVLGQSTIAEGEDNARNSERDWLWDATDEQQDGRESEMSLDPFVQSGGWSPPPAMSFSGAEAGPRWVLKKSSYGEKQDVAEGGEYDHRNCIEGDEDCQTASIQSLSSQARVSVDHIDRQGEKIASTQYGEVKWNFDTIDETNPDGDVLLGGEAAASTDDGLDLSAFATLQGAPSTAQARRHSWLELQQGEMHRSLQQKFFEVGNIRGSSSHILSFLSPATGNLAAPSLSDLLSPDELAFALRLGVVNDSDVAQEADESRVMNGHSEYANRGPVGPLWLVSHLQWPHMAVLNDRLACHDIDECALDFFGIDGRPSCHQAADSPCCLNTPGGFECLRKKGVGRRKSCPIIDGKPTLDMLALVAEV